MLVQTDSNAVAASAGGHGLGLPLGGDHRGPRRRRRIYLYDRRLWACMAQLDRFIYSRYGLRNCQITEIMSSRMGLTTLPTCFALAASHLDWVALS
jgi:hypothetical protein